MKLVVNKLYKIIFLCIFVKKVIMQDVKNSYILELIQILRKFDPYLILLFGSYASGTQDENSDIDIFVVTKDNFIPKNFEEKSKIYQKISRAIRPVKSKIAVDLIVHTLPMFKKFISLDSAFAREIIETGKVLYKSQTNLEHV